jgi:hypothetical protein
MSTARRGATDSVELITVAGSPNISMLAGTVDPSAGAGVAANEGSIYFRYGAGAGQVWYKTGAANTAWTRSDPTVVTTIREMASEKWVQNNVAAGQAAVDLSALLSTSFDDLKMIRAGSIVGLGTRFSQAITDATANSCIVRVAVNGVAGTLNIVHTSGSNPSGGEATQAAGIDTFVAGDRIGVEITTLGSFTPVTTDVEALLELQF